MYRHISSEDDFPTQILDFLFIGNEQSARDTDALTALGVGRILNMAAEIPDHHTGSEPKFIRLRAELSDFAFDPLLDFLPRGVQFIDDGRTEWTLNIANAAGLRHGAVLVHCRAGRSRSAAMVVAYIMYHLGYRLEQAVEFVTRKRPSMDCYNFKHQLEEFERKLDLSYHFTKAQSCYDNGAPFRPEPIAQVLQTICFAQENIPPPADLYDEVAKAQAMFAHSSYSPSRAPEILAPLEHPLMQKRRMHFLRGSQPAEVISASQSSAYPSLPQPSTFSSSSHSHLASFHSSIVSNPPPSVSLPTLTTSNPKSSLALPRPVPLRIPSNPSNPAENPDSPSDCCVIL